MKMIKRITLYVLSTIFALSVLAIILISNASSTVLNEDYVLSKLEEEKYYDGILVETKSNFEKYIYQSGLDESVIDDLVTKEKIKEDTKIILDNIYFGSEKEVNTNSISEKLNSNIEKSLNGKISSTQKKSIDDFVKKICEEYTTTINDSKYKKNVHSIYEKINNGINTVKKIVYISSGVSIVLIVLLSIKKPYKLLTAIGVASIVDGCILLIIKQYVFLKVSIKGLTIFNEPFSNVLRVVLLDFFDRFIKCGYLLLGLGIVFVILFGIIKGIRKQKREKEQYTPEN